MGHMKTGIGSGLAQRLELQHWMEEEKAWSLPLIILALCVSFAGRDLEHALSCAGLSYRIWMLSSLSDILRLHTTVFSLHISDRNLFVSPSVTLGS